MAPRKHILNNRIRYFTLFFEHLEHFILKNFFQVFQHESRSHMKITVIKKASIRHNGMQMGIEI